MNQDRTDNKAEPMKKMLYKNGKIYFDRGTERSFFFFLTIVMLLLGLLAKAVLL